MTLIEDGTYYVHEAGGEIVACGGWSRRNRLYTGSGAAADDGRLLDPATEPARVRAMFVRGDWARRGLGRAILEALRARRRGRGLHDAGADGDAAGRAALPRLRLPRGRAHDGPAPRRHRARGRRDGAAVRLILITGPPGSGKTSVLTALSDALSDDDVPHAAVEVEALAWTHPALDDERRLAHVRTVCAGHDLGAGGGDDRDRGRPRCPAGRDRRRRGVRGAAGGAARHAGRAHHRARAAALVGAGRARRARAHDARGRRRGPRPLHRGAPARRTSPRGSGRTARL